MIPEPVREPVPEFAVHRFFVDESGDLVVFGKRRRVVVGSEGCSRFFLLGAARVDNPDDVFQRMEELRAALLADPYFKGVPSMQPDAKKTAACFHAKNDVPEVRRAVFQLLPTLPVTVRVAVWNKTAFASGFQKHARSGLRFDPNDIYDNLVKELFHDQLSAAEANTITFARRGKAARIEALANAITHGKEVFRKHYGGSEDRPCEVLAAYPSECVGLRLIDYYLWACQRWLERGEDRFYRLVERQFKPPLENSAATGAIRDPAIKEFRTIHASEDIKKERPSSELGSE